MPFPDFQDFLATLTTERMVEICSVDQPANIIQISDIRDERNISAFVSHIMNQSVSYSMNVNLNLLRAYHEWLQEQIQ